MSISPFSELRGRYIRKHVFFPLLMITVFLFWVVSEVLTFEQSHFRGQGSSQWWGLWDFYHSVQLRMSDSPKICHSAHVSSTQLNSFQAKQCHDFMSALYFDITLGLIPIVLPLFLYFVFAAWASWVYATAHRLVRDQTPKAIGILTEPMELPMDAFGWWGCLRPVMIQLKDSRQIKVYLSYSDQISAPGRRVAVFKLFAQGKRRYVAIPYLPELFIRSSHHS